MSEIFKIYLFFVEKICQTFLMLLYLLPKLQNDFHYCKVKVFLVGWKVSSMRMPFFLKVLAD
jgi:hypothetical protein